MTSVQFHQFEVTRRVRGTNEIITRTVILPADTALPGNGFWVARNDVRRLFPNAIEVRALGETTRQIWEVVPT